MERWGIDRRIENRRVGGWFPPLPTKNKKGPFARGLFYLLPSQSNRQIPASN
jgi:hypothetical protein